MIVKRKVQKITSPFGFRFLSGKKVWHNGVDLRTREDTPWLKLPVVAPEQIKIMRVVYQGKWGYTIVAQGLESGYTLKFTHVKPLDNIITDTIIEQHEEIAWPAVTRYMEKKKYGEHLHFEVWKSGVVRNPVKYMDERGIEYI